MTIDEQAEASICEHGQKESTCTECQTARYLRGFSEGADPHGRDYGRDPLWTRGYAAGRAAYLAAEQAERERLERRARATSERTRTTRWGRRASE
jgi:hypothetical protein